MGKDDFYSRHQHTWRDLHIGIICSFAHIRYLKYRVESMTLIPNGSIGNFITASEQQVSATGEGVMDVFDFDLSL